MPRSESSTPDSGKHLAPRGTHEHRTWSSTRVEPAAMSVSKVANATVLPHFFLGTGGYEPSALLDVVQFRACQIDQRLKERIWLRYNRQAESVEAPQDRATLEILQMCRNRSSPVAILNPRIVQDFSSTPNKTAVAPEDRIPEREFENLLASLMRFLRDPS